ncbi:Peptidase C39 family protein [Aureliella helgolandensis]|uniref:Peptidase C39 family protein n=2 Tax=Aureliella helgolandensis TaxID=2527968 RepID=A0A518G027_9BACT|nr:Peptidase C39 family protein [Aureliella helgolandensis]
MKHALQVQIQSQPNDSSCGPTCLAAVYQYWNDPVDLNQLIIEIGELSSGGTLAVQLGCHALQRGYDAVITTHNLQVFDPSWFREPAGPDANWLADKLKQQYAVKRTRPDTDQHRLQTATESYLKFLTLGGRIEMRPINEELIVSTLSDGKPMLCGVSATYLYQERRERWQPADAQGKTCVPDDIGGDPTGHFVVLHGYDPHSGNVQIADPLHPNPIAPSNQYVAARSRVTAAILLGIVTYDANLLTLTPRSMREASH